MWIKAPRKVTDRIQLMGSEENCVYLVEGKEAMIIGGSMSFLIPELEKQLEAINLDPARLKYQLIPHSHFDHCGAVPFFKRKFPGLVTLASEVSKKVFAKEKVLRHIEEMNNLAVESMGLTDKYEPEIFRIDTIPVDRVVREGDTIDLGDGILVRIIEMPGHSKCSIASYIEAEKALFPSDAIPIPVDPELRELLPMANDNFPSYLRSLEKISSLDVEICCLCHRGAFTGDECKRIVRDALPVSQAYYRKILDKYREFGNLEDTIEFFAREIVDKLNLSYIKMDLMRVVAKRMIGSVLEAEGENV